MNGERGAVLAAAVVGSVLFGALTAQLAKGPNIEASTPENGRPATVRSLPTTPEPAAEPARSGAPACAEAGLTPTSDRSGTCAVGDKTLVIAGPGDPLRLQDVAIRVLGATFTPASTPSGRARKRARVTMRVRVTNTSEDPIQPNPDGKRIYLTSNGQRVDADPAALDGPGALRGELPVAAGESITGTLRFELAGAITDRVAAARRLDVGVDTGRPERVGVIRVRLP